MTDKMNGCHAKDTFEEIEIPVPWGHIRGKWWGSKSTQPVLALHGWQDNAGTFDNLAPLLVARGHSLLCVDFPGHGLSSHYAPGHFYFLWWDGVHIVRRIIKHFAWDKVTIVGHSLGGAVAFLYAAVYPNQVEKYVSFDIAGPSIRCHNKLNAVIGEAVDRFLKYENFSPEEMPCHTYEEALDVVFAAYNDSVTEESCKVLMRRGTKPADHKPGHFVFTRDPRLKLAALGFMSIEQVLSLASRITCEVMNVRGNPGMKLDFPEYYEQILEQIEKNATKLERHVVEGTHHLHLNNAERVVDIVHDFLAS